MTTSPGGRRLIHGIRMLVAFGFMALAVWLGLRNGLPATISGLSVGPMIAAMLVLMVAYAITFYRWFILMRAVDVPVTLRRALQLSMIGIFFNNIVPGSTGGDVVRAYYIAKSQEKRTRGVVSVIMDRIIGLSVLAFMAGLVTFFCAPDERLSQVIWGIRAIDLGVLCVAAVFYSKRLRRMLALDRIIARLPFQRIIREVDHSLFSYRHQKKALAQALALSFAGQVLFVFNNVLIGRAIGIDCSDQAYYVLVPILSIISAIPVAPQGWGISETVYPWFFGLVGVPAQQAVALSILYRLSGTAFSLLGGLVLAFGGESISARKAEEALRDLGDDSR